MRDWCREPVRRAFDVSGLSKGVLWQSRELLNPFQYDTGGEHCLPDNASPARVKPADVLTKETNDLHVSPVVMPRAKHNSMKADPITSNSPFEIIPTYHKSAQLQARVQALHVMAD